MEAFSLLRYWRNNGGAGAGAGSGDTTSNTNTRTSTATTIVTAVSSQASETGDEEEEVDNDHGPFFDLEFSLPEGDEEVPENGVVCGEEEDDDDEDVEDEDEDDDEELKFTLLSGSSGESTTDANASVSPSDDLFFKGDFVPVEQTTTETNSKPPQFRVSLMKSATKFRVMMLKLKKSKGNVESSEITESNASSASNSKEEEQKKVLEPEKTDQKGESMTVKFKIEEVPIVSLFKRHNSSKSQKKRQNNDESVPVPAPAPAPAPGSTEEKKFSKEAMQKYLRKVKPLYVRVSKRYVEKLKFSGQLNLPRPPATEQKQSPASEKEGSLEASEPALLPSGIRGLKQGNLPATLRVVCKHLGKSRSASMAVVAASPPGAISSKRRDDSLLQQQDGIQSAILHCKRSFKASRDSDSSSSISSESTPSCTKSDNNSCSDSKETRDMNKNNL